MDFWKIILKIEAFCHILSIFFFFSVLFFVCLQSQRGIFIAPEGRFL
jgi:hypothetical protein